MAISSSAPPHCGPPLPASDADQVQFAMNLEFLEAEFFLYGAHGEGLDKFAPYLTKGGPPPVGGRKANLDPLGFKIIEEFAYQEIGHLRAIYTRVGGIPRPLLDISKENFAKLFDQAVGYKLVPPFDPYANTINYLLATYVIPYVGLVSYVGTAPYLHNFTTKALVAGLLGVESGQDAVTRTFLYERKDLKVLPYNLTVAELTDKMSKLRNRLAMCGIKDEGLIVPRELGAEGLIETNILSADDYSLSYARTPQETLRTVYDTGDEHVPGGFYPHGANGRIARMLLKNKD
ncbi:hypothetical protein CRG98_010479 [Punica granatum]|nr:hypothetical protein CRG98_010479 [Punica granatum]